MDWLDYLVDYLIAIGQAVLVVVAGFAIAMLIVAGFVHLVLAFE